MKKQEDSKIPFIIPDDIALSPILTYKQGSTALFDNSSKKILYKTRQVVKKEMNRILKLKKKLTNDIENEEKIELVEEKPVSPVNLVKMVI